MANFTLERPDILILDTVLEKYPNSIQLQMLVAESNKIINEDVRPTKDWFYKRMQKMFEYSGLNWAELAQHADTFIAEKALKIQQGVKYLVKDWETQSLFDLVIYQIVITDINKLWLYYEKEYTDENFDIDVSDLISSMKFL